MFWALPGYTVIPGASGTSYQTPPLTASGTYYVHVSYLHGVCDPQDYYFTAPVVPTTFRTGSSEYYHLWFGAGDNFCYLPEQLHLRLVWKMHQAPT